MNNTDEVGTGVPPKGPSARKGIHQHDRCIFPESDMGRHGLVTRRDVNTATSSSCDQGVDETDNVMSKHVRQTSPIAVRQKKNHKKGRRNSLTAYDPEFSEDDDSESDDMAHQSLPSDFFKTHNSTSFSESNMKTQMSSSNHGEYFTSYQENKETEQSMKDNGNSCVQIILPIIFVIISIATALYYSGLFYLTQETNIYYDEFKFNKDLNKLGVKYKISDNSILEVQTGISTILERNDTGSFVFVYNGKSSNFNYLQFSNFMQDIASTTARYLRNDTLTNQPTIIQSSELRIQSHSELMNKYRHEVAKTGVMLVKDVDRIPSSLAMAFHYFCDEYNPLVAKSAIFFTLNLANCSNFSDNKFTHHDVEKCLANVWNTVPKDNIKPLLARVVNVVIDVTSVNG